MLETGYQSKIMKSLIADGGRCVNGQYTKAGEHDLQGGYPFNGRLYDLTIEVKTEHDYNRVMSALRAYMEDGIEFYQIIEVKKLKNHEPLQVMKLNQARMKGGLSLFAFDYSQVKEYCERELND